MFNFWVDYPFKYRCPYWVLSHWPGSLIWSYLIGGLVHLFSHVAHFCAHVTHKEETNCCYSAGDLCYPECRVPAVPFGNGAEWQASNECTNWKKTTIRNLWLYIMEHFILVHFVMKQFLQMYHLPSELQWHVMSHRNWRGRFHSQSPPNKAIGPYEENPNAAPRIKIQSCRTEIEQNKQNKKTLKMANKLKYQLWWIFGYTSFSETPVWTETGWSAKTHSGASWETTHDDLTNTIKQKLMHV